MHDYDKQERSKISQGVGSGNKSNIYVCFLFKNTFRFPGIIKTNMIVRLPVFLAPSVFFYATLQNSVISLIEKMVTNKELRSKVQ